MIYSRLTLLKNQHRLKRKELAEILGVTETGLDYKLNKESFTVKDIEVLASYFKVKIGYFFEEKDYQGDTKSGGLCIECLKKDGLIEGLQEMLKEKDLKIEELSREIGRRTTIKRAKAG